MEWISVEDELPNDLEVVLVCDYLCEFVSLGIYQEDDEKYDFLLMYVEKIEIDALITHWIRIPRPPKPEG